MKNIIQVLENTLNAFKHAGWVNGLTEKQYDALNEGYGFLESISKRKTRIDSKAASTTAKVLKKRGYTIREIARTLGYKNPGSISHLLNKK